MEAQGSVLTNKYAEGYPQKRWYGGCEFVDVAEQLAIDRAKQLFGAEHANVQPHSGSGANMAVYFAFLKPGDKMLTMDLSHGGHLTHGNRANFSGKFFEIVHYGVRKDDERIDYDQLASMAREHRPKMITVGASAYPRIIDFERMAQIAADVGAMLLADIAHIAGLVAPGLHPSPVPHADFVTTTTHKTLRGPRGGLVLCKAKYAKEIDSCVFPGIQGGPLMHVIAAKAVCFEEALSPSFKSYQQQILQQRRSPRSGHATQWISARLRRHGKPSHARRCRSPWTDRQGLPARPRRGRHHRQQEHHPVRNPVSVPGQRHPSRLPRRHHPRHEGKRDGIHRRHDQRSSARYQKRRKCQKSSRTRARADLAIPAARLREIAFRPRGTVPIYPPAQAGIGLRTDNFGLAGAPNLVFVRGRGSLLQPLRWFEQVPPPVSRKGCLALVPSAPDRLAG
jgi:hypothetical protein